MKKNIFILILSLMFPFFALNAAGSYSWTGEGGVIDGSEPSSGSTVGAEGWVCEVDPVVRDFSEGLKDDLSGAHFFSDEASCTPNCYDYAQCKYKNILSANEDVIYMNQGVIFNKSIAVEIANRLNGTPSRAIGYLWASWEDIDDDKTFSGAGLNANWKFDIGSLNPETNPWVVNSYSGSGFIGRLAHTLWVIKGERKIYSGKSIQKGTLKADWEKFNPGPWPKKPIVHPYEGKGIRYIKVNGDKLDVNVSVPETDIKIIDDGIKIVYPDTTGYGEMTLWDNPVNTEFVKIIPYQEWKWVEQNKAMTSSYKWDMSTTVPAPTIPSGWESMSGCFARTYADGYWFGNGTGELKKTVTKTTDSYTPPLSAFSSYTNCTCTKKDPNDANKTISGSCSPISETPAVTTIKTEFDYCNGKKVRDIINGVVTPALDPYFTLDWYGRDDHGITMKPASQTCKYDERSFKILSYMRYNYAGTDKFAFYGTSAVFPQVEPWSYSPENGGPKTVAEVDPNYSASTDSFTIGGYVYGENNSNTPEMWKTYFKFGSSDPIEMIEDITPHYDETNPSWDPLNPSPTLEIDRIGSVKVRFANNGWTCPAYKDTVDVGGTVGGGSSADAAVANLFSTKNDCDNICKVPRGCVNWQNKNCRITGAEEYAPVTDYTGKTIFTKKKYTWSCKKEKTIQEGCNKWKIESSDGSFDYNLSAAGYETKDFTGGFTEAFGTAISLDRIPHIWSGWRGECDSGIKFDNSWMEDPIQIAGLLMTAYSGVVEGGYGTTAQKMAEDIKSSAQSVANDVSSLFSDGSAISGTGEVCSIPDDELFDITGESPVSVDDFAAATPNAIVDSSYIVDAGSILQAVSALSSINEGDVKEADKYLNAMIGEVDPAAVNYLNCMDMYNANIINQISYSLNLYDDTPDELRRPLTNPFLNVPSDIVSQLHLVTALANEENPDYADEKYVFVDQTPGEPDKNLKRWKVFASDGASYTQLAQLICAGERKATAMNAITNAASSNTENNNANTTEAVGMAALNIAVGMLPPPYNLLGSVALKALTSVQKGNACTDKKMALTWGPIQIKTNSGIVGGMCVKQKSSCMKKWTWGDCMWKRHYYCCYDDKLTRIIVQGLKKQLDRDFTDCQGISMEDLHHVSFAPCNLGEDPKANKCFPLDLHKELRTAMMAGMSKGQNFKSLTQQMENAITVPANQGIWDDRETLKSFQKPSIPNSSSSGSSSSSGTP